jgi:hypothetical protein
MYLGTLYIYTKFWPDRISNMAVGPAAICPITLEKKLVGVNETPLVGVKEPGGGK